MKDDITIFCGNVKAMREKLEISMKEMAGVLEITVECLEAMERGVLLPEVDVGILYCIYDQFGIWPSQMFREDGIEAFLTA